MRRFRAKSGLSDEISTEVFEHMPRGETLILIPLVIKMMLPRALPAFSHVQPGRDE